MWIRNVKLLRRRDKISELVHSLRKYSQAASILTSSKKEEAIEELGVDKHSLYPPVKPKYPPGQWGRLSADSAWKIHELTHEILQCPSAKWRLENLAGCEDKKLWLVNPLSPRPRNLPFQQLITRSHLIDGTPEILDGSLLKDNLLVEKSSELIQRLYEQEYNHLSRNLNGISHEEMEVLDSQRRNFLSRVSKMVVGLLSGRREHLKRGEIDEGVRVETFWRVGGFEGEERSGEGSWEEVLTKEGEDAGLLQFQYRHDVDLQLRSEMPLPEFISTEDPVCRVKEAPMPSYAPDAVNFELVDGRPTSVAGQWIGGGCEFIPLTIHHLPSTFVNRFQNYGASHLDQAEKVFLVSSMFASCLAQAHNQGFCDLLDLTYPITTQCILSTSNHLRFAAFQLNTAMLWNDANPLQNIAWISPPTPLFTHNNTPHSSFKATNIEAGGKTINPQIVRMLLSSFMLEPKERGVHLRPYLPHDPSPLTLHSPINHLGQPPPDHYIPGRFEYPKNAVYF